MAVLGSKPVLLHQVALGHQDRRFLDSGLLVIGMQTVDPPVRGQRVLDFVTQDSLDAVTYPLGRKTFSCYRKVINDGRNGIQYMARLLTLLHSLPDISPDDGELDRQISSTGPFWRSAPPPPTQLNSLNRL
jgi:hypothetical protein